MSQTTPTSRRGLLPELSLSQKKVELPKEEVGSYVFMKCHVSDVNCPRITEIALVAVTKEDLQQNGSGDSPNGQLEKLRYKDTLVLAFDPQEAIHVQDACNSDLDLDMLKNGKKYPFESNAVSVIAGFLSAQHSPVCLVSHGGNSLDFRVLRSALQELQMSLSDSEILCVDTLDMFSRLDSGVKEARLSDYRRYSLDNLYRRYFGGLQLRGRYDAKSSVMKLLDIVKKVPANFWDLMMCKKFADITVPNYKSPKLCGTQDLLSPLKRSKLEESPCSSAYVCKESNADDTVSRASQDLFMPLNENQATETFVFLDLETTGLDTSTDSIVEICACAVSKHVLTYLGKSHNLLGFNDIIPRLVDEVNYMVLPLSGISPEVSRINGIKRMDLEIRKKTSFTIKTANNLEAFLERQAKPICFVAHNGFKFDFEMLRSHLKRTKTSNPLWDNVHCSDTLTVLRKNIPDVSHRLSSVFSRLMTQQHFSLPPFHSAEGDVLRLIAITRLQENMVEWLEKEKELFISRNAS